MSQSLKYWQNDAEYSLSLPDADKEVIQGVIWGEPGVLFTPAYWFSQFFIEGLDTLKQSYYTSHKSIYEEVVFCMLGGFGISAEQATAAYNACKDKGLIDKFESCEESWVELLKKPLVIEGSIRHYRFPNQKGKYIASAMSYLKEKDFSNLTGKEIRDELLQIKGIGYKTAGWIARNYTDTDDVAILDIHLIRACTLCGIFTMDQKVERDYSEMENRFLEFCDGLNIRPAILDCLMWDQMRYLGSVAHRAYKNIESNVNEKPIATTKVDTVKQLEIFSIA